MPIDLPPKVDIWLPPKPAIIRLAPDLVTFPFPMIAPVAAASLVNVVETNSDVSPTGGGNPKTITGMALGAADDDRDLIILVGGTRGATGLHPITALTVGGNSATSQVTAGGDGGGASCTSAIFTITAGSGDALDGVTSADIVITGSNVGTFVCTIVNVTNLGSLTANDTDSATGDDPAGAGIDCNAGGIIVAETTAQYSSGPGTVTWTNLATEADDRTHDGKQTSSSAYEVFSSSQSSLAVSADYSAASPNCGSLVIASFDAA